MRTLKEVFGVDKPIIGMLHLAGFGADETRVRKLMAAAVSGVC